MPSSSDQFPDPWNLNRPDDSDETSGPEAEPTTNDADDDFGLAELEALLSSEADSRETQSAEFSFDDLETLLSFDAETADDDTSPDFDALLASLDVGAGANEPKRDESPDPAFASSQEVDRGTAEESDSLQASTPLDFQSTISEESAEVDVSANQDEIDLSAPSLSSGEERGDDTPIIPLPSTADAADINALGLNAEVEDSAIEDNAAAAVELSEIEDPALATSSPDLPAPLSDEMSASEPATPLVPSDAAIADEAIPERGPEELELASAVVPSVEISGSPAEGTDSNSEHQPGEGAETTGTQPSLGETSPPRGISSYKQILEGRQQISAFALVLAGMGGVMGYGWSKANLPNPLKVGLNDAGIGLLTDSPNNSQQPRPPSTASAAAPDESEGEITPTQPSEVRSSQDSDNELLVPIPSPQPKIPASQPSNVISNIGGLEDSAPSGLGAVDESTDLSLQTPPPIDISDVPSNHWAHPYVMAMYEQGVLPDFPDGKFQPDKPVTRAELAASIQRAFQDQTGADPIRFNDIPEQYWARDAVTHAVNSGFMSGYSEDIFEPNQQIPRYQVLVSLASGLGLQKIENPQAAAEVLRSFPDVDAMPDWALGQVAASQQANLIVSRPDDERALAPTRPATRAEVSAMIYQALVNSGKIEDTVSP